MKNSPGFVHEIEELSAEDDVAFYENEIQMAPCPPRRRQSVPNIKLEGNRSLLRRLMNENEELCSHRAVAPLGVPQPPAKPKAVQRRPLGAVSHHGRRQDSISVRTTNPPKFEVRVACAAYLLVP